MRGVEDRPPLASLREAGPAAAEGVAAVGGPARRVPPASAPIEGEPPLLARPVDRGHGERRSAVLDASGDSWVRYVSSGIAAADGVVPGAGATGVAATLLTLPRPPEHQAAPSLNYTVNFAAKESWYDPLSGEAGIYGSGNVAFRYTCTHDQPHRGRTGDRDQRRRLAVRSSASTASADLALPEPAAGAREPRPLRAARPSPNEGRTLDLQPDAGQAHQSGEKVFAGFYPAPSDNEFGCVSASFTLP